MESVILYLALNILRIYSTYRLIGIFLEIKQINKLIVFLAYCAFYIVNSSIYLIFKSPLLNIASNIIPILLLTYLYISKIWKKIFVTILIYAITMFWDSAIFAFFKAFNLENIIVDSGFAFSLMLFFTALLIQAIVKNEFKASYSIRVIYYLILIFIPVASIIIGYLTMLKWDIKSLVIAIILLLVNFLVFYLFNEIIKSYMSQQEAESIKQNKLYFQHELEVMEKSQLKMDCLRHDMKNHFFRIKSFANEGNIDGILNYVEQGSQSILSEEGYVFTGNKSVDCILNYKLDEANKHGIDFLVKAAIPNNMKISSFDINTILGNILDNAIEAASKASDKKIDIFIDYNKSTLVIIIINSFDGKINKNFETTKADSSGHGLGLKSVQITAEKYNGLVEFKYDNTCFSTKILLYDE